MWELFFEGFFWNFLPAILSAFKLDWTVWSIHSSLLFPKIAKCEYFQYGLSGSMMMYDAICVLPQNVINEMVFAFIFFWNILMVLLCIIKILSYLMLVVFKCLRLRDVCNMTGRKQSLFVTAVVTKQGCFGIWFLLHQVRMNVHRSIFNELIKNLFETLRENSFKRNIPSNKPPRKTSTDDIDLYF